MSERLTTRTSIMGRKHDIAYGCASIWKKKLKNYKYELIENAVDKLGQLEDIEEELGIDLVTFVKLNKTDKIYDKEEETFMFFNWIDLKNKCLVCEDDFDEMSGGYLHTYYYFKDYGKKWALTKKEFKKYGKTRNLRT